MQNSNNQTMKNGEEMEKMNEQAARFFTYFAAQLNMGKKQNLW